MDKIYINKKYK